MLTAIIITIGLLMFIGMLCEENPYDNGPNWPPT